MRTALSFLLVFAFAGLAEAQYCHQAAIVAPVYAAPLVSYQPIVQLQQVVAAPAPIVQQQVQAQVQQVVTAPALPILQYQPVIAAPIVQAVVSHHQAAAIVVPQRVVARNFIVGNRVQRVVAVQAVRARPVLQLNVGRRR